MKYFFSCFYTIQLIALTLIMLLGVNQSPVLALNQSLIISETLSTESVELLENNQVNNPSISLDFLTESQSKLNSEDLLKLSVKLRDIARFLSPKWPLIINLHTSQQSLLITDFKTTQPDWIPFTVGYGLKLVSQELSIIEHSTEDTTIDLLITDNQSNIESQWLNVPLADFCSLLYFHLQQSQKI